eukprot:50439-Prorocentrum_minimum.AAC.1
MRTGPKCFATEGIGMANTTFVAGATCGRMSISPKGMKLTADAKQSQVSLDTSENTGRAHRGHPRCRAGKKGIHTTS